MEYDLIVIGGGINGCGICADAAGRGLKTLLIEQSDLGFGTSSASSRLIHGGIRYLENFEFSMVRDALIEQDALQHNASHLIHEQQFIMPLNTSIRPNWLIKIGLFLYDYLFWQRKLQRSRILYDTQSLGLKHEYTRAVTYADCTVDDARLVIKVALLAQQKGAKILTKTPIASTIRHPNHWEVFLDSGLKLTAKAIVNATGSWVNQVNYEVLKVNPALELALVRGTHIVVPKLTNTTNAYILQNPDNRVVFVIPFLNKYHLIGTTEVTVNSSWDNKASSAEITYLCESINAYFKTNIQSHDLINVYAGIRPLIQQSKNIRSTSRDYQLILNQEKAPLLSVYGGKLTTYRKLSEQALNKLKIIFPQMSKAWTKHALLPGSFKERVAHYQQYLKQKYSFLSEDLLTYYIYYYGNCCELFLKNSTCIKDLGIYFGGNLYALEVIYLLKHEWATCAEDILWRRTKQGFALNTNQQAQLQTYIEQSLPGLI